MYSFFNYNPTSATITDSSTYTVPSGKYALASVTLNFANLGLDTLLDATNGMDIPSRAVSFNIWLKEGDILTKGGSVNDGYAALLVNVGSGAVECARLQSAGYILNMVPVVKWTISEYTIGT